MLVTRSAAAGAPPALLPNLGGTLPNDVFTDDLGLPTIWIPHSYPACAQHAPDEHLLAPLAREGPAADGRAVLGPRRVPRPSTVKRILTSGFGRPSPYVRDALPEPASRSSVMNLLSSLGR